ncbi:endonuclease/exonuclease/phosphatase family protein [Ensifer soli]|uniref:endonuclease/exonuclease/phosphatase family protein n=1 Tax=Ciceribacter sp. sgz301302 TaxID=3342379 RepID=UPI0035BA620A
MPEARVVPPPPSPGLTIASYNVHKCVGLDKRFDPARIAAVIGEVDADIVALQEADQRFGERAGLLDLDRLRRDFGLVQAPIVPRTARGHGWHGNLILVREGVVNRVQQMSLPGVEPRGAVLADVELAGVRLRVVAAHLGLLRHSRTLQARAILTMLGAQDEVLPTVLLGDLNEWRKGRRSSLSVFTSVFDHPHPPVASFPARRPIFALDRVMGNTPGLVATVEVHDTPLSRVASDHLPVKARLDLSAATGSGQSRAAPAH